MHRGLLSVLGVVVLRSRFVAGGVFVGCRVAGRVGLGLGAAGTGSGRPRLLLTPHAYVQVAQQGPEEGRTPDALGCRQGHLGHLGRVRPLGLGHDVVNVYVAQRTTLGGLCARSSSSPWRRSAPPRSLPRDRAGARATSSSSFQDVQGYDPAHVPAVAEDCPGHSSFRHLAHRREAWSVRCRRPVTGVGIFLLRTTARSVRGRLPWFLSCPGPPHPAALHCPQAVVFLPDSALPGGVAGGIQTSYAHLAVGLMSSEAGIPGTAFDGTRRVLPLPRGVMGFALMVVIGSHPGSRPLSRSSSEGYGVLASDHAELCSDVHGVDGIRGERLAGGGELRVEVALVEEPGVVVLRRPDRAFLDRARPGPVQSDCF